MPEKGRWPYADVYMGDGWSLAYRTLDAHIGESPSEENVSILSQILLAGVPENIV